MLVAKGQSLIFDHLHENRCFPLTERMQHILFLIVEIPALTWSPRIHLSTVVKKIKSKGHLNEISRKV